MDFDVIYDFDIPKNLSVKLFQPPNVKRWRLTEGDEQYEYTEEYGPGKHRKYVAYLSQEQFDKFVERCGLHADSTPTGGMIGSSQGPFWSPAIAFEYTGTNEPIWCQAYVCPYPSEEDVAELGLKPIEDDPGMLFPMSEEEKGRRSELNWNLVVKFLLEKYE